LIGCFNNQSTLQKWIKQLKRNSVVILIQTEWK
jgi:hypothetical protein